MKKTGLFLAALLVLNVGTGFAAPINDLAKDQTAVGIGTDTFYLEHKLTDNFTLGFQNIDWDHSGTMNDIYGQFDLSSNFRAIIGSRDFDYGSKMYAGLAVNGPIAPECNGYASLIGGDSFKELQVGTNFRLSSNVDLNVNYHSYMPDAGRDSNGIGVGATFKF